jgi:hypothetical protein
LSGARGHRCPGHNGRRGIDGRKTNRRDSGWPGISRSGIGRSGTGRSGGLRRRDGHRSRTTRQHRQKLGQQSGRIGRLLGAVVRAVLVGPTRRGALAGGRRSIGGGRPVGGLGQHRGEGLAGVRLGARTGIAGWGGLDRRAGAGGGQHHGHAATPASRPVIFAT